MMNSIDFVSVRLNKDSKVTSNKQITGPKDALELVIQHLGDCDREFFACINLDVKSKPLNINVVSIGTLDATLANAREVYKASILSNAYSVLFIHNHPSGDVTPSIDDLEMTAQLVEAGRLLGLNILDHVIINSSMKFHSIREKNAYHFSKRPNIKASQALAEWSSKFIPIENQNQALEEIENEFDEGLFAL